MSYFNALRIVSQMEKQLYVRYYHHYNVSLLNYAAEKDWLPTFIPDFIAVVPFGWFENFPRSDLELAHAHFCSWQIKDGFTFLNS